MRSSLLLLSALVALFSVLCTAQAPIPYRPDGFAVGGVVGSESVVLHMDLFFDLLCPDCAAAWPNLKPVIDNYRGNMSVAVHTFPLPYRQYSDTQNMGMN